MKSKIKEYWEKLKGLLNNKNVVFGSPFVIFVIGAMLLKSIFMIIAMVFWMLVLIANTDAD